MFSILICTYDRWEILGEVLLSIIDILDKDVEVIVINNNPNGVIPKTVAKLIDETSNIRIVVEHQEGLSYARNRAVKESKNEWLFFLDDDAKPKKNLISKAREIIAKSDAEVIGGVFLPWYRWGRPKWYKDEYASNEHDYINEENKDYPIINLHNGQYITGCIMLINKTVFKTAGMFRTDLGMKGKSVGYGEETEWQDRARAHDFKIIMARQLLVDHAVLQYKLDHKWFLKARKRLGKDLYNFEPVSVFKWLSSLFIGVSQIIIFGFINFIKLITTSNYYYQNFILDTFMKPLKWLHFFKEGLSQRIGAKR